MLFTDVSAHVSSSEVKQPEYKDLVNERNEIVLVDGESQSEAQDNDFVYIGDKQFNLVPTGRLYVDLTIDFLLFNFDNGVLCNKFR